MAQKKLLFSVTMRDFEMQTFSVGGHGGGGKDTSNSGVRLIHRASGAVGEGREHRTNTLNRRSAFTKLVNSAAFQKWHRSECARRLGQPTPQTAAEIQAQVDARVDQLMQPHNLLIEEIATDQS
jgi:protein subunit release factor B